MERKTNAQMIGSEKLLILNVKRFLYQQDENKNVESAELKQQAIELINKHTGECDSAVYVGTYAKYNAGSLYGMWVDLETFDDAEEFIEFCKAIHSDEQDPELMYQDYKGFPEEYYSESGVTEHWEAIQNWINLDEDQREAVEVYLEWFSDDKELDRFEDRYCGQWDSLEDYACDFVHQCYEITEFMENYFDYKKFAKNLKMEGYIFDKGYVFNGSC